MYFFLVCLLPSFGSCLECRNLTTFDMMCEDESIVYILSGSPCQSNTTVTLTIINKNTQNITMKTVNNDINDPVKLGWSICVISFNVITFVIFFLLLVLILSSSVLIALKIMSKSFFCMPQNMIKIPKRLLLISIEKKWTQEHKNTF